MLYVLWIHVDPHGTIILSYAFKMRQDYLSTIVTWINNISRVSEAKRVRYELIQVTCAEIILSHFESI